IPRRDRFVADCAHHHPVFRYRTPRVIRAFVPRTAGFFKIAPVSASVSARQKGGFDPLSLHQKIPFLTRISETGSMTGWWVASLCPSASSPFEPQIRPDLWAGHFRGIFGGIVSLLRSPVTLAVSRVDFSDAPLLERPCG